MTVSKKGPFSEEQFTATRFDSASDKATWANKMASWITRGFPENGWNKNLYTNLHSHMYGHIAHYNQHGFYAEWFADIHRQLQWLEYAAKGGAFWGGMGDPAHCWSDVERAFSNWIRASGLVSSYQQRCAEDIEKRERAQLSYLQRKYIPLDSDNDGDAPIQKEQPNVSPCVSGGSQRPTPVSNGNTKHPSRYQQCSLFDLAV